MQDKGFSPKLKNKTESRTKEGGQKFRKHPRRKTNRGGPRTCSFDVQQATANKEVQENDWEWHSQHGVIRTSKKLKMSKFIHRS